MTSNRPTGGASPVGRDRDGDGNKKWLAWLLGLAVIAALVVGAFFLFDDDADDPDDVDVDPPALDVTTPDVDAPAWTWTLLTSTWTLLTST